MLELPHLVLVQELDFAFLVDPGLAFRNEKVDPSGSVFVLPGLLLRSHQLSFQPMSLVDGVIHMFIPHILLELVVLDLGLSPAALTADLEQVVSSTMARYTVQEVKHEMQNDEVGVVTGDEFGLI